ncbi:hypothetical protein ACNJFH_21250, partial [Mycobacterium tuberculosis]
RLMQGVSVYADRAARVGGYDRRVNAFTPHAWFTTLTNVNFDDNRFVALIAEALRMRNSARDLATRMGADLTDLPEPATWQPGIPAIVPAHGFRGEAAPWANPEMSGRMDARKT